MTMKIKGMRFFDGDDGRHGYTILAHAEIEIEDLMNLNNVTLAWSEDRGYTALAPIGRDKSGLRSVIWNSDSSFARLVAEKMRAMYRRMGGKSPVAAKPDRRDHVTGKPIDEAAGLHRVLGVGAVEETMARAGL